MKPTGMQLRLAMGLAVVAAMVPMGAHADQRDTAWTIGACDATGQLDDGTSVTVRLDGCAPGKFSLRGTETMAWTGFSNDWYTPDIPSDQKFPSLDDVNSAGRVLIEFSSPVANPVLHLADLGGANTNGGPNPSKYSQRWKLATPGVTLSRLSGTKQLAVSSDTIQISNLSGIDENAGRPGDCGDADNDGLLYGCGSIQLNGTVTSVAFDVDMRAAKGCCSVLLDRTTFTVTSGANEPPATPNPVFTGPVGSPLTGKVESTDPDGDKITYTVPNPAELPPGVTIAADGTLSGTPTKAGTYQVTTKACDGKGGCTTGRSVFVFHECPSDEETPGSYS